ncbi:MAG: hypothetical protein HY746_07325, partial [Elusimicrobia bacterium]|nr:hypothetical protein [Elusimicrobiota bacterium]
MNKLIYWLSKPWFFIIVFVFLLTPSVKITNAIESGADFLNTTIGARPSAMGNASVALSNDINAVQTNPAGLAYLNTRQFGAMRSRQYFDATQDFIGFAFPTKNIGTLALSITRLAHEKIEGRTSLRQTTQGFTASDQTINL